MNVKPHRERFLAPYPYHAFESRYSLSDLSWIVSPRKCISPLFFCLLRAHLWSYNLTGSSHMRRSDGDVCDIREVQLAAWREGSVLCRTSRSNHAWQRWLGSPLPKTVHFRPKVQIHRMTPFSGMAQALCLHEVTPCLATDSVCS